MRLTLSVFATAVLIALAPQWGKADDKSDRERKVRVAIALAEAESAKDSPAVATVAPDPRSVVPKDYAIGRKESLLDRAPLVVYVSCDGPKIDGAITCFVSAKTFGDVTGPAVVVGYPSGDRLLIEKTLHCPVPVADLKKAVDAAAKKIETPPKQMPASTTANYRIDADTGTGKGGCICSDSCACKVGECPAKCPVVTPTLTLATVTQSACQVEYFYGRDGRLYQRTVCPLKQQQQR